MAAGLDRERVIATALDLLQEGGLAAISTRRVAERLGVQSPALYWHVRDKQELLALVADAICAGMALPSLETPFRLRLKAIASEYRRVLIACRDAPRLFAEQPPIGQHRMKLYDAAVGALLDAGFPSDEAIALATFYRHYLLGMITEEVRERADGGGAGRFPAFALGVELQQVEHAARDYPNLAGAAALLRDLEPAALFEMGLEVILDGFERRAAALAIPTRG
jgi:TetR/AcrR family tetracycline transcriptional repressor